MSPKAHAPNMFRASAASNPYTCARCGTYGRECAQLPCNVSHASATKGFSDDDRVTLHAQLDAMIARSRGETFELDAWIRFYREKDRDAATGRMGGRVAWGEP